MIYFLRYDNLAVNYLVALPPGWEAGEGSDLVGSTQHCYTGGSLASQKRQDNNVSIEYIANTLGQQTDYLLINTGANEKGDDVAHFSLPITADLFFNINQVVGRYR